MKIQTIALLAICVPACFGAANSSDARLAVYYSFDVPPPAVLLTEMQSELGRILAPAALAVTWRSLDAPRTGSENFPAIAVLRFRGNCSLDGVPEADRPASDPAGMPLADAEMVDGRVFPFGAVECNALRRFIAPTVREFRIDRNAALGRALARVSAHEIYHMLTGSSEHGSEGIARASHSRADLTAPTFTFAKAETEWLRAWANKRGERRIVADESWNATPALAKADSGAAFAPLAFAGH